MSMVQLLSKLVLPGGLVIAALLQQDNARMIAALVFAAVIPVVAYPRELWAVLTSLRNRSHDRRLARASIPVLRKCVGRCGEFVGDRSDTLDHILRYSVARSSIDEFEKLRVVDANHFRDLWRELMDRYADAAPRPRELARLIDETSTLVNAFVRYAVAPVFDRWAENPPASLEPRCLEELAEFRERFVRFRDELKDIVDNVQSELRTVHSREVYLPRPKPLLASRRP